MMSTAQTSLPASDLALTRNATISVSSLAILTDSRIFPSASHTHAQWWALPTSMPTHAISRPTATRISRPSIEVSNSSPVEHPADASVNSDQAQISISSQGAPKGRANIPS